MAAFNANTLAAAFLSDALRQWLRARPEPAAAQELALGYEAAVLIARRAPTVAWAHAAVDLAAAEMKAQITLLGVGPANTRPPMTAKEGVK